MVSHEAMVAIDDEERAFQTVRYQNNLHALRSAKINCTVQERFHSRLGRCAIRKLCELATPIARMLVKASPEDQLVFDVLGMLCGEDEPESVLARLGAEAEHALLALRGLLRGEEILGLIDNQQAADRSAGRIRVLLDPGEQDHRQLIEKCPLHVE